MSTSTGQGWCSLWGRESRPTASLARGLLQHRDTSTSHEVAIYTRGEREIDRHTDRQTSNKKQYTFIILNQVEKKCWTNSPKQNREAQQLSLFSLLTHFPYILEMLLFVI